MTKGLTRESVLRWIADSSFVPIAIQNASRASLSEMEAVRETDRKMEKLMAAAEIDYNSGLPVLKKHFEKKVGYVPDFENPVTFNEKVNWRKLFDRNPVYPLITDKLGVREFVAQIVGPDTARSLFPNLRGVSARPTARWLRRFVDGIAIKANNGCGANAFVMPGETPDWDDLARKARLWMHARHGIRNQEWAYWLIPPRVIVEDLLLRPDGRCADDLKFSMFDGVCRFYTINTDRFSTLTEAYFWPDGTFIDVTSEQVPRSSPIPLLHFDQMLSIAEKISAGFDYIRVDFLVAGDRFALNELTVYRGSGLNPFIPERYDWEFGSYWTIRPWQDRGARRT